MAHIFVFRDVHCNVKRSVHYMRVKMRSVAGTPWMWCVRAAGGRRYHNIYLYFMIKSVQWLENVILSIFVFFFAIDGDVVVCRCCRPCIVRNANNRFHTVKRLSSDPAPAATSKLAIGMRFQHDGERKKTNEETQNIANRIMWRAAVRCTNARYGVQFEPFERNTK